MSVDQEWKIHLLHLDLNAIVTTIKSMDIEHMTIGQIQCPIGLTKGIIMHLTMYVPNVTSMDIQAKTVGPKHQHQTIIPQRKRKSGHWTNKEGDESNMEEKDRRWKQWDKWSWDHPIQWRRWSYHLKFINKGMWGTVYLNDISRISS